MQQDFECPASKEGMIRFVQASFMTPFIIENINGKRLMQAIIWRVRFVLTLARLAIVFNSTSLPGSRLDGWSVGTREA